MFSFYKRYLFDFCIVYKHFFNDESEAGMAFFAIAMKQTAILSGITNSLIVFLNLGQEYFWIPITVPILFIVILIINFKWVKVFEEWKKEWKRKKGDRIRITNWFIVSFILCVGFASYTFHLLSNYW